MRGPMSRFEGTDDGLGHWTLHILRFETADNEPDRWTLNARAMLQARRGPIRKRAFSEGAHALLPADRRSAKKRE